MTMKGGIHMESELKRFSKEREQQFKDYQEKAQKFETIVSLAKEENDCRSRIKAIAQERAKLIGVTEKYRKVEE